MTFSYLFQGIASSFQIPYDIPNMLTWTQEKPNKPGWYWFLNPGEEPGLPTIVQIVSDWQSGRSLVLIPVSPSAKGSGIVQNLQDLDAMWAGPIELPVVLSDAA